MDAWIPITIAAAAAQTVRFMLQKHLKSTALTTTGATFARFAYSAPLVVLLIWIYARISEQPLPAMSGPFWAYALAGGLTQILATMCVVALFAERNFAVGITFKKTEVIQTVLVGLVVLGDRISLPAFAAILLGLIGVLVLSDGAGMQGNWTRRLWNRAAGLGLASGAFFAVSAVGYRGATLEVGSDDPLLRAGVSLAVVTVAQTVALGLWLNWREPGQLAALWSARRTAVWMGITGMAGSLCWFTAFTQQNAAYVFAVGQIEVIFSLAASVLVFNEKISRREALGIALLTASILGLILLN